jgi:hypothetical protein
VHVILGGALLILLLFGCDENPGNADRRQGYWKERVKAAVPVGSSRKDAIKFLDESGLHPYFDETKQAVVALERNVEVNWPVSWAIIIECNIDANERVRNCGVEKIGTGP